MKNQKVTWKISFVLAISVLIYLIGCRKLENNNKPSSTLSEIKIENKNYNCTNLTLRNKKTANNERLGEEYTINDITVNFSEAGMQTLYEDIESFFGGDIESVTDTPKVIVLYTSDELTNIHFNAVMGISYFLQTDTGLLQRFFQIENGNMTNEDSELTLTCSYFSLYELDLLTIAKFNNPDVGWALFQENGNGSLAPLIEDFNNFGKRVVDISEVLRENADCSNCGGGDGGCEDHGDHDGQGNPKLVCGACRLIQLNSIGVTENYIVDSEKVNVTIAYDFRDNFLVHSEKGQQYIDYYYKLSYISQAFKMINAGNFFQHLNLAYQLTNCAEILQNGNNSEIPISSQLQDDALDIIELYREISPNTEFQEILSQIESDINYYAGQTRAEILASLQ